MNAPAHFPRRTSKVDPCIPSRRARRFRLPGLCFATLLMQTAGGQAVKPAHQYDFNNSFADAMGGPSMESGGGVVLSTGYCFRAGQGPNLSHALASPGDYTIEMVVKLRETTRYRALINLDNVTGDRGLFVGDGSMNFFPINSAAQSPAVDVRENQWHRIVLTRDGATSLVSAYVDGTLRLSASDPKGKYIANANTAGIIHFCRDNGREVSAGELDQIRIHDRPLTAAEVAAIPPLPKALAEAVAVVPSRPAREIQGTPPIANAQSISLKEGGEKRITLTGSDSDAGTFLSYLIITPPAHGKLAGAGPGQIYTPVAGYHGADSFTYRVHDGAFGSTEAAISLTITAADPADPLATAPASPAFVDPNPSAENGFGFTRVVLSSGNVVITSPQADIGGVTDCGAVYLFNGSTGALISTLTGSAVNDFAGSGGVTALTSGNFVVCSPQWDSGQTTDAGAATWGSGSAGISGTVNAANSLAGAAPYDLVGNCGVTALANGNYVVSSRNWDLATAPDAGAATWGNGQTGIAGPVSPANSLTGSSPFDLTGLAGVTALANGNYVVSSSAWDHRDRSDAGAVTWGNGSTGIAGPVSTANSLTGSTANDLVGGGGATALPDGNYVVHSPAWDHGTITNAGAVTRCDGSTGLVGTVSAENSKVGAQQ